MKKYNVIYADPPWPIKWGHSAGIRMKELDYPIMTISEIISLNVKDIAADDCTLFLWTTNGFLPEALGVVKHWGFRYEMLYTWCKNNGMGGHPRNATEHMIIATRGNPKRGNRNDPMVLNWINHSISHHSVKPNCIKKLIEKITQEPRIELFARTKTEGWDVWGNEVKSDIDLYEGGIKC